jgi:uncharacterized protein YjdB
MVIQTWFLWDLSQSFKPKPEKFFENLYHIMSSLSPKEAHAGIVTVFGPKQFIRTTGKPNVYQDDFTAPEETAQLVILNGEENGQNRVSSAIILLNGEQIFGTRDFNQNVFRLEKSIELSRMNTLTVELRSKPESYLNIEIIVTTANNPPSANAGQDQNVTVGSLVTLDGRNCSDPDGDLITYGWTIVEAPSGSIANLNDPASVIPTFIPDIPGQYRISLIVNDGQADSVPDEVIINAIMPGPVMVTVPDVVGSAQATAEPAIVAAGLTLGTVTWDYHDTIPPGNVISQNPAGGSSAAEGSPVNLVISQQIPAGATTAWIGPSGGTITEPSGASVIIPPGALTEQKLISIKTRFGPSSLPAPTAPWFPALGGATLGPNGLVFQQPALLTLPLSQRLIPGSQYPLFVYDEELVGWRQTEFMAVVNSDGLSASAEVSHFSTLVFFFSQLESAGLFGDFAAKVAAKAKNGITDFTSEFMEVVARFQAFKPIGSKKPESFEWELPPPRAEYPKRPAWWPNVPPPPPPDLKPYNCWEVIGMDFMMIHDFPDWNWPAAYFPAGVAVPRGANPPTAPYDLPDPLTFTPSGLGLVGEFARDVELVFSLEEDAFYKAGSIETMVAYGFYVRIFLGCACPDILLTADRAEMYACERTNVRAGVTCGDEPMKDWTIGFDMAPGSAAAVISSTEEVTDVNGDTRPIELEALKDGTVSIRGVQFICEGTSMEGLYLSNPLPITVLPDLEVVVEPPAKELTIGRSIGLSATVTDCLDNPYTDCILEWSSNRDEIAYVSPSGSVIGYREGQATITAVCKNASGVATIRVTPPNVSIQPVFAPIAVGDTAPLTATVTDSDGKPYNLCTVAWYSNNVGVADVNASGIVIGKAEGQATISAVCGEGIGVATVQVFKPTVTVEPAQATIMVGNTKLLTATVTDSAGNPYTGCSLSWYSNDVGVANVISGLVTGISQGVATISAVCKDAIGTATVMVIDKKAWIEYPSLFDINRFSWQMPFARDGNGNLFVAGITCDSTEQTGIFVSRVVAGQMTEMTRLSEPDFGALLAFFVDKAGNMFVVYNVQISESYYVAARRYSAESGWEAMPKWIYSYSLWDLHRWGNYGAQIAADQQGNAIITWTVDHQEYLGQGTSHYYTIHAIRYDVDSGWEEPIQLATEDPEYVYYYINPLPPADWQIGLPISAVAMSSEGDAILVWTGFGKDNQKRAIRAREFKKVDNTRVWGLPRRIASPGNLRDEYTEIVMDPSGNAIVMSYSYNFGTRATHYRVNDGWQTPFIIGPNSIGVAADPPYRISMNKSGNAMLVYAALNDVTLSILSKQYVDGVWDAEATLVRQPVVWQWWDSLDGFFMDDYGNATLVITQRLTDSTNSCGMPESRYVHARQYWSGVGWDDAESTIEFPYGHCELLTNSFSPKFFSRSNHDIDQLAIIDDLGNATMYLCWPYHFEDRCFADGCFVIRFE